MSLQSLVTLTIFAAAVAGLWLVLSVLHRLVSGKGFGGRVPADAQTVDLHAYGRSLRNGLTEAKGVVFPLVVAVSGSEVHVTPRFPATLFFLPEIFDLEHRIPLRKLNAQLSRDSWSKPVVHLGWDDRSQARRWVELHLRQAQSVIDARDRIEAQPGGQASPAGA